MGLTPIGVKLSQLEVVKRVYEPVGRALEEAILRAWELKAEGYRVEVRGLRRGSKVLARGARAVNLGSTPLHPLLVREALTEAGLIRSRWTP